MIELVEPNRFELTNRTPPDAGPGEIVIEMRALGLCGTDLHIFAGRGDTYPHVVGHDGAGVVVEVGEGVDRALLGQRITVDPMSRCGSCSACVRGTYELCPDGGYLGMLGPGLLGQFVRIPAAQAIPIPDQVSYEAATALEPIAVALHTLHRIAPLLDSPWPTAVVGGGPLGILLTQVFEHFGHECVVFEPEPARRELGTRLGLRMHAPEPLEMAPGPRVIVETSAARPGVELADAMATPGSVVAVVGRAPESITPSSVLLKELTLVGVRGGPGAYDRAVSMAAEGTIDTAAVISHRYDWSEAMQAFRTNIDEPGVVTRAVLSGAW